MLPGVELLPVARQRCRDRDLRALLLVALAGRGVRARQTRSGVWLSGPRGTAAVHWSGGSDHRNLANTRAAFRQAGIPVR